MTEKELLEQVRTLARMCGWLCYHTYRSVRSEPGFPDLTLVRGRRLLFVELKSEKGRVTEAQQQWLDALGQTGVETYVWRPRDLDEIGRVLSPRYDGPPPPIGDGGPGRTCYSAG